MKIFIATCLKENQADVIHLFKEAGIGVFSATDVIGFKDMPSSDLRDEWFAAGEEQFDSTVLFSFTSAESAAKGLALIQQFNFQNASPFPVRAFIVPVEQWSHSLKN